MTDKLFVYGTLGPGRPNEHVMQAIGGNWLPASLQGKLVQAGWGADMGFPALEVSEDGERIDGHVFISANLPRHWDSLDEFEGAEYERVITQVTLADGQQTQAYVYALRKPAT